MTIQSEVARLFVGALAEAGVRDVVVSPGSRSTPFVHAAREEPRLRCHVVIDERAAAFHALGRAKASGSPVALLCTSGSAPAHYLPALVEASHAHVPLVVLTADRPLSLQACGASQTVDQVRMFGEHARSYAEVATDARSVDQLRAVRRTAVQAVHRARHPLPGPVHVNLRCDKPLEPLPPRDEEERRVADIARSVASETLTVAHVPRMTPSEITLAAVAARIVEGRRGVVVCGPAPVSQRELAPRIVELARRAGYALFAEATSQARFTGDAREGVPVVDAIDLVLPRMSIEPDLILQLGAAPVSSHWDSFLRARPSISRVVVAPHGWPDPAGTATDLVQADVGIVVDALLARLEHVERDAAWLDHVTSLERSAWAAVDATLAEAGDRSEGGMTRALCESLPRGALLAVSNSLPVRHLDTFCPGSIADVRVLSQRGAAGIDGLVSGACGAADALGVPAALLCGDLALLHDLHGLEIARRVREPFVVVVLQNDGGRIFEQLPIARATDALDPWTTPHGLSFEHAAAMFGHRYARVSTGTELRGAVRDGFTHAGCTIVEAVVDPHGAAHERARLEARVMETVA